MPKSKKNKLITLSKTQAAGREGKERLMEEIRDCLDVYTNLFVFSVQNMRTNHLKDVRRRWNTSRFFFGKNKVMQIALGKDPESEYKENLHLVAEHIGGTCGLLFTNEQPEALIEFFKSYKESDYARSGFIATKTIELDKGPLEQFAHSLEPHLRTQLGMPTSLRNGVIHLEKPFTVCRAGQQVTPEQAKLLKLLDEKMSEFQFELVCLWSGGKFKRF